MWKKIILGVAIAVVSLCVIFQVGYYATSGPSFCGSCHETKDYYLSWQTSAHNKINCLKCHQPLGELSKFHAKARGLNYVFQHFSGDYTILTRAIVSDQNCIQCHLGDDKSYPDTIKLKNTSKVNHYETIKNSQSCMDCHRSTGHATDIHLSPDLKGAK